MGDQKSFSDVLTKYNHPRPKKPVFSPYKAAPINYGAKVQYSDDTNNSAPLNEAGIRRVQGIVGALLYYACAVDNKLLHALSKIGTQQAAATESTNNWSTIYSTIVAKVFNSSDDSLSSLSAPMSNIFFNVSTLISR
jgi:hypothetical protein